MCGIWALIGIRPVNVWTGVNAAVATLKARGPEQSAVTQVDTGKNHVVLGFTRLAINGLTADGDQPMHCDHLSWICNGEIYNYKDLAARHGIEVTATSSDCQILGPLYEHYADDLPTFFRALDGVFALVLVDRRRGRVVVGRDPYGVRPLFYAGEGRDHIYASEIKALAATADRVSAFKPGTYAVYEGGCTVEESYHVVPHLKVPALEDQEAAEAAVRGALVAAVKKRMLTERPVAALLSGGVDSSLIAALVARELRQVNGPKLKTFSIGFEGSEDLRYARMVAAWIGSEHHEIVATPDEFFAAIPEVIRAIESYDTTTVRASVGNYLVARAVRTLSDCKVVFNGDGSDEVFGSYMYFYAAPTDEAFEAESARLLTDIHMFDVLRSDRSISSHGLEPRTPFLDKQFVATARSVSTRLRRPVKGDRPEKWILRQAFADTGLLPNEVLWRKKEAFSDGVSGPAKLWYQEIQERVGSGTERDYYESLCVAAYGDHAHVNVPYRWMPRWCPGATDPSARTLASYTAATTTPKCE